MSQMCAPRWPLWLCRMRLYFILFTIVIIASHLVFLRFGFSHHTDVDSARVALSAIVTSEATIVALVITFSLVAVQLAASSYSTRVIDVFKKAPDTWIVIGTYFIVIIYGMIVLKMIERVNPVSNISNLEIFILLAYYLCIFAISSLIPYILNTLNLLKPSTVIKMLSERITKQRILLALKEKKIDENDPIQPIIDIVRSSLMKYDYETVRDGLRAIGDSTNNILKNETFEEMEETKVSEHVFAHLTRVGRLAVSQEDDDSTLEVIINLCENGKTAVERGLHGAAAAQAIDSIRNIGKVAVKRELEISAVQAINSLKEIGKTVVEKKLQITQPINSLTKVGIAAAQQKLEEATFEAALSLGEVGKATAERKLNLATGYVAFCLRDLGKVAAEQKLMKALEQVALSLEEVIKTAKEQKLESAAVQAEEALNKINDALSKLEKE
jgi:hypothetical protein